MTVLIQQGSQLGTSRTRARRATAGPHHVAHLVGVASRTRARGATALTGDEGEACLSHLARARSNDDQSAFQNHILVTRARGQR